MDPGADRGRVPGTTARRLLFFAAVHLAALAACYASAFQLRFDFDIPADDYDLFLRTAPWVLLLKLAVFCRLGSFQSWWRYVTLADLSILLRASTLSGVAVAAVDYFFIASYQIPRAVLLLDWGLTVLLLGGLRSSSRLLREEFWAAITKSRRRPALIIGAESGGEALARQIEGHPRLDYRIVGFLDENRAYHGSRLGRIPFLGGPLDAARLAEKLSVRHLLVIDGSLSGETMRALVQECRQAGIELKVIPPVDRLLNGPYRFQVRDVKIDDLLRRAPVRLDLAAIGEMLRGKRVMVTGGGGSIGSEICRQVMACDPEELILVERAENSLFHIERELKKSSRDGQLTPCIADIGDLERMRRIFRRGRPHIVFHAAAHKHVPLMETAPGEAIKNNVFGTKNLADLADRYGVERFVLVSTDKAVNPTSVMGATKQIAERYIRSLTETSETRFIAVRFGNVLASAGSVVPIFQEQIRAGGPVTVTHPQMTRYFMTIPEASQLVLQAAAMGKGGEIFVLDMGEPVKIADLARDLIRLSGVSADAIEIVFTGPRPGEKLFEELSSDGERLLPTCHPKVQLADHALCDLDDVRESLADLATVVDESSEIVREALRQAVSDYAHGDRGRPVAEIGSSDRQGEVVAAGPDVARALSDTASEANPRLVPASLVPR